MVIEKYIFDAINQIKDIITKYSGDLYSKISSINDFTITNINSLVKQIKGLNLEVVQKTLISCMTSFGGTVEQTSITLKEKISTSNNSNLIQSIKNFIFKVGNFTKEGYQKFVNKFMKYLRQVKGAEPFKILLIVGSIVFLFYFFITMIGFILSKINTENKDIEKLSNGLSKFSRSYSNVKSRFTFAKLKKFISFLFELIFTIKKAFVDFFNTMKKLVKNWLTLIIFFIVIIFFIASTITAMA